MHRNSQLVENLAFDSLEESCSYYNYTTWYLLQGCWAEVKITVTVVRSLLQGTIKFELIEIHNRCLDFSVTGESNRRGKINVSSAIRSLLLTGGFFYRHIFQRNEGVGENRQIETVDTGR